MKKLLVFDLDGTLIDSRRDLTTGINLTRRHYGLGPLDYDTVTGYVGNGIRKLVERSFRDAPSTDLDEALKLNLAHYREHLTDQTCFYPGVETGLRAFVMAGYTLAVLTNKAEELTRIILEHFGVTNLFDYIIGDNPRFPLKPNPASLNYIVAQSGIPKDRCWMIGDHHTDLQVAENAGIATVFCQYGIGSTGDCAPTHRVENFDELIAFFK